MTKELTKPSWYSDEFYNKSRTPEEWLYELCKRYQFNKDNIGFLHSISLLSAQEQEKRFVDIIFEQQIEKLLNRLEATPPQPIKYPSVSDIFLMYHLLTNSDWYKNNPNRDAFESAISIIINEGTLSSKQQNAFSEMYKTPWCAFNENHQQDSWCPKKEIHYLTGIPLSLVPGYSREDTLIVLNKKLNAWVGKLQDIQLQFDSWQERKILAVFDLRLWFKIQRIKYTKIGLHKLIWPNGRVSKSTDEEVEPNDDIKHSISLANRVIDKSPITSLLIMCEARKFKKETTAAV